MFLAEIDSEVAIIATAATYRLFSPNMHEVGRILLMRFSLSALELMRYDKRPRRVY